MNRSLFRIVYLAAFAAHLVVAALYLVLSPKGFPFNHSRFWLNSILPAVVTIVAVIGLCGLAKKSTHWVASVALLFSSGWIGGCLAARVFFPTSLRGIWALGMLLALLATSSSVLALRERPRIVALAIIPALSCLLTGAFSMWAQVPQLPSTRPFDSAVPLVDSSPASNTPATLPIGGFSSFNPRSSELIVQSDDLSIRCYPRLQFDRVSPDRFWSLLAPRNQTNRRLLAHETANSGILLFAYHDQSIVELMIDEPTQAVQCVAWRTLTADTYSHLNSFAVFVVDGHQELTLEFSPCEGQQIEVLTSDYPVGRPARIAFLDEHEEFRIVEASCGEKGPFSSLATGQLKRGKPLSIALYDEKKLAVTIQLDDWSRQVSTDLSPSAGWGLPMNAIEFRRTGESSDSPVEIFVTLAATWVGRGWETVGHRAGVYRNRLHFRLPN